MFSFNKASSAGAGTPSSTGLFGQKAANTGGSGFSFGQNNANNSTGGGSGGGFSFGGGQNAQSNENKGGLFGNKPAGAGTGTGFSFGQQQPQQPSTNTGLFGSSNTNTNSGSGGLFGSSNSNTGTGGLFGSGNTAPGANSGGLFGSKPAGNTGNSSLFGQNNASNNQGGLFGNSGATNNNSLFGNNNAGTSGGLFGSKPAGTSLFGNSGAAAPAVGGSLFGSQQPQQQQQQSALQAVGQLAITPITKIADLPPQIRQEIEQLDQYIQRQVQISQHLKADTPEHKELIDSIPRDIAYLLKTESLASQSLAEDLKKITSIKVITDQSITDTQTFSMILQQLLTPGSKISSIELDKFFHHRIQIYQNKLDDYFRVLSDIESAVNGVDTDVFGAQPNSSWLSKGDEPSEYLDVFAIKTGINALVSTVIEEFSLFMDTAERVAQIHQKVKELTADNYIKS